MVAPPPLCSTPCRWAADLVFLNPPPLRNLGYFAKQPSPSSLILGLWEARHPDSAHHLDSLASALEEIGKIQPRWDPRGCNQHPEWDPRDLAQADASANRKEAEESAPEYDRREVAPNR